MQKFSLYLASSEGKLKLVFLQLNMIFIDIINTTVKWEFTRNIIYRWKRKFLKFRFQVGFKFIFKIVEFWVS